MQCAIRLCSSECSLSCWQVVRLTDTAWIQHLESQSCENWLYMLYKRWVRHGITVNLANLSTKRSDCGALVSLHGVFVFSLSVLFRLRWALMEVLRLVGLMGGGQNAALVGSHGVCCNHFCSEWSWTEAIWLFSFFSLKPCVHVLLWDRQVKSVTKDGEKNSWRRTHRGPKIVLNRAERESIVNLWKGYVYIWCLSFLRGGEIYIYIYI